MLAGHGAKSGRKRELAIAALLTEPTVEAAALKAGVGYRTLKSWLKDREFLASYRRARSAVVEGALGRLQQVTGEAVDTLRRNLTCGRPGDEIKAAVAVLDHAIKAVELADLEARLTALEDGRYEQPTRTSWAAGSNGRPPR
jgi:hypothetical protein